MKRFKLKVLLVCVLTLLLGTAHLAMGSPANDYCQNAQLVSNVTTLAFETTSATFDGPGHCMNSPNIWFLYIAPQTCNVTVSLCGSQFDTMLAVYEGSSCYPAQTDLIDCGDDECDGRQSLLTFAVTFGHEYLIEVGGFSAEDVGNGVISISCQGQQPGSLTNDNCQNAQPVGNVTNLAFDTTLATFDGPGYFITTPNIWYCYTATCTGNVTVNLCGSKYDTELAVYKGYSCYPMPTDLIEYNDDDCAQQSRVTFAATVGEKYLIEIGGAIFLTSEGVMSIRCEGEGPPPPPQAPSNDDCYDAKPVGNPGAPGDLPFDTSNATFDGPGHFMTSPNVWYCYTATCTGDVTVDLCNSSYDTKLAVYKGCGCYPASNDIVASNDDDCAQQSRVTFAAIAGEKFLIEVGGYGSSTGEGVISIHCEGEEPPPPPHAPPNDDCYDAKPVGNPGAPGDLPFDTSNATFDGPGHFMTSPNIWYCYTATCTGEVTIDLCGSSYDTKLAVYKGCGCYPASNDIVASDDDDCAQQSRVTFAAIAGEKFLIEVGGYGSSTGEGVISIRCEGEEPPPPPHGPSNDDCYNAKPVGNVTNLPFDTSNATFDGPGHFMTSPNIWYCYTATCTGFVTIDLCGSRYDTMLAVYKGCGCYPTSSDIVASNDDDCAQQSRVTFPVTAGEKFLIEVGGYGSRTGEGVISIRCVGDEPDPCPPSNDKCINAQSVGNVTNQAFDTTCATFDGPGHFITSPNIWYLYKATSTTDVTVSLCGSKFDTKLAIYKGGNCYPSSGALIKQNDDFCSWQSEATFAATAGQTYLIEVGGFGSQTGQGMLTISSVVVPPPIKEFDLGDAPDSTNNFGVAMTAYGLTQANFPTVFNDASGLGPHGPIHQNPRAVAYLGSSVSLENEADIGPDEDGINNNIKPAVNHPNNDWYDNGVVVPVNMPDCRWTTFNYLVKVINPGTNLWVNVWFDWNRDGDWDDDGSTYPAFNCSKGFVSEWAVQNQYLFNLPAGLNKINTPAFLPWHPKSPKEIWMRITLSEKPWRDGSNPGTKGNGGSGPQTGYDVGETEDYYFVPDTSYSECEDFDGNGVINIQDLSTFVGDWLANCPQ